MHIDFRHTTESFQFTRKKTLETKKKKRKTKSGNKMVNRLILIWQNAFKWKITKTREKKTIMNTHDLRKTEHNSFVSNRNIHDKCEYNWSKWRRSEHQPRKKIIFNLNLMISFLVRPHFFYLQQIIEYLRHNNSHFGLELLHELPVNAGQNFHQRQQSMCRKRERKNSDLMNCAAE